MDCRPRLPQGQGPRLSPRIVDDAAARPPCAEHGPAEGHVCLAKLAQGTLCNILKEQEIKPHKVRYYLERRDPEFKQRMAEVLCVYREVKLIKETTEPRNKSRAMRWRSSPTMRSLAFRQSPRRPRTCRPSPADIRPWRAITSTSATARSACWPASICSRPGPRPRQGSPPKPRIHRIPQASRRAYPTHTAIKLILDNHSAHISKETKAWLADQPVGRFEFTFTPKHGSWLNLVEGFFSKLARSVLRHIRCIQTGTQGPHHGRMDIESRV